MAIGVGNFKPPANALDAKKAAIEAARNAAAASKQAALGSGAENTSAVMKYIRPAECSDRIRIVFDDSGSMSGQITNAKQGVVEFLRNCIPNQTAVAVHFMCTKTWSTALRSDLPLLGSDIEEAQLTLAGTPMFNTMLKAVKESPLLTRMVVFTDGSPTDQLNAEEESELQPFWGSDRSTWIESANIIIKLCKQFGGEKCIPIDTVFFGGEYAKAEMDLLRYLSDKTGGFFLHFNPAKVNFKTAFKYLAPVNRLMLSSGIVREEIESGKRA